MTSQCQLNVSRLTNDDVTVNDVTIDHVSTQPMGEFPRHDGGERITPDVDLEVEHAQGMPLQSGISEKVYEWIHRGVSHR